ncbi:MAG TPA: hypothetical protein VMX18_04915 [Candidatus Bipolaricaulota bacterium]|nr:hypothetical protein [Candidatus Bipolaricaulota bacterium]
MNNIEKIVVISILTVSAAAIGASVYFWRDSRIAESNARQERSTMLESLSNEE